MASVLMMKGFSGTLHRAVSLPVRYGMTSTRIRRRLERMVALCRRWDLAPTIPVTASVLSRHRELVSSLAGVDVALHGFQHVAYCDLSTSDQAADLDAARSVLHDLRISARGFRAPYLRLGRDTRELLRRRGFLFDSSVPELVLPRPNEFAPGLLESIRIRYGQIVENSSHDAESAGLVELPVSLPDDEILVDALRIRNPSVMFRIFEAMLGEAKSRSSILVLQIHPERYNLCSNALELVLERATDEGAWKVSLTEAAGWIIRGATLSQRWPHGHPYAIAVTGDLDAAALGDFAPRIGGGQRWKS